jgi:2Fe-2S ferredoxin
MGAAQDLGYYWPTTCGGEGRCTTCACEVLSGADLLEPMGRTERKSLVEERGEGVLRTAVRLACQTRIRTESGTVVVRKPGVRPPA